jgi:membrane protease YdiL (CAAX protease family)
MVSSITLCVMATCEEVIVANGSPSGTHSGLGITLVGAAIEGGLALLAVALGWLLGPAPLETFAWTGAGLGWGLLAALPMLAVFLLVYHFPGPLFRPVKEFTAEAIVPLLAPCNLFELFVIAFLAGLGEEMLFRGVLQAVFAQEMPFVWALLLASVLFGLLHAITLGYALLATLLGAYLGLVWVWTGNLLAPVVAHFLYDFVALVYLLRRPTSSPPPA